MASIPSTADPSTITLSSLDKLHILTHPILQEKMTLIRSAGTRAPEFRQLVKDVAQIIGYEAAREMEVEQLPDCQSPVAKFTGARVASRIGLHPILRAGIGMTDGILSLFPNATVLHLGLFRNENTLDPVEYYNKLPKTVIVDEVFILDPIVATGGTAIAAVHMLQDWGIPVENIKLLCLVASFPGLQKVMRAFPELEIWTAAVDQELTKEGMISPGLGDSGDRLFGTGSYAQS
ncbi:PRTase-like protein [Atractiella rhizophila]|nr:PRTase-like protein [Atractiella rhizophila]